MDGCSVSSAVMETDGEQNQQGASTNGSAASGTSSRPSPMNSMSLYERQAVQVGVCVRCVCVCERRLLQVCLQFTGLILLRCVFVFSILSSDKTEVN